MLAARPKAQARMDEEDRLKYIKECKARLGLNDNVLLASSRRAVIDSELKKEMPSLEFNGLYPGRMSCVIEAHEMKWS